MPMVVLYAFYALCFSAFCMFIVLCWAIIIGLIKGAGEEDD